MSPPTEQLIRDYLNRVSVAARGRLSADERRAFLARTREFIEQSTRALGQTDAQDVIRLLTGLGDPAVLVDRERDRLAAQRAGSGDGPPPDDPRAARARRWRPPRGKVTSLLTATAAAVAPGETVPVPEPADDAPLTGELRFQTRPISARWRPGAPMTPKPRVPKPREPKPGEPKPPHAHRPGFPRRFQRGVPQPRDGQSDPAADQPGTGTASQQSAESAPPLPADIGRRPGRPGWPSLTVNMPPPDGAVQGNGHVPGARVNGQARPNGQVNGDGPDASGPGESFTDESGAGPGRTGASGARAGRAGPSGDGDSPGEPAGPGPGSAGPADPGASGSETGGAEASGGTAGGQGSNAGPADTGASDTAADAGLGAGAAAGGTAAAGAPPRDARIAWASGVRSRAMRIAALRAGGARSGAARSAGQRSAGERSAGARGGAAVPGDHPAGGPRPGSGAPDSAFAPIGPRVARAARIVAVRARRHPLEAVAVVLLGLGGLIFPPVWLIGAAVALLSKVWDFRDKWVGLVVPVFLVIAGMVADVSLGGNYSSLLGYIKEAWVFGGHISRIAAVLGAVYLAWRAERGRRPRAAQPWNKPHRFG